MTTFAKKQKCANLVKLLIGAGDFKGGLSTFRGLRDWNVPWPVGREKSSTL